MPSTAHVASTLCCGKEGDGLMVMSEEAKAARALARALDARSFDLTAFVQELRNTGTAVDQPLFSFIKVQLEAWQRLALSQSRSHPLYKLWWSSRRMLASLEGKVPKDPPIERRPSGPHESAPQRPLYNQKMIRMVHKTFPDALIQYSGDEIVICTRTYGVGDPDFYKHRPK